MAKLTLSFEETVEPDTPRNREFIAMIRAAITEQGWDVFEQQFVEGMKLILVKEENGLRYYERPDGQFKMSIGISIQGGGGGEADREDQAD